MYTTKAAWLDSHQEYEGWSDEARQSLEQAIARHGGRQSWMNFRGLRLTCTDFSGIVGRLKGEGKTFELPRHFVIDPKNESTTFPNYPENNQVTAFERGVVRIKDGESILFERCEYRRSFDGLAAKLRKWSPADICYFIGYSMSNYHSYPFLIPHLRLLKYRTNKNGFFVRAEYPEGVDCHSRKQTFHFSEDGLLTRVEYSADIVGPGPSAAHHYENYTTISGILVPRRRRVLGRVLGILTPMNMLTADFEVEPEL